MRSFGVIQCSLIVEDAIEQVAHALNDASGGTCGWQNFYADSDQTATQSTPYGQQLKYAIGQAVWQQLAESCDFAARHARRSSSSTSRTAGASRASR